MSEQCGELGSNLGHFSLRMINASADKCRVRSVAQQEYTLGRRSEGGAGRALSQWQEGSEEEIEPYLMTLEKAHGALEG